MPYFSYWENDKNRAVEIDDCENDEIILVPGCFKVVGKRSSATNIFFGRKCCSHSLEFEEGVETIQKETFCHFSSLERVAFPNTLKKIENSAFGFCKIKELELPTSLEYIGDSAFCANDITSVRIPPNVKFVGRAAFCYCKNLKEIKIYGETDGWDSSWQEAGCNEVGLRKKLVPYYHTNIIDLSAAYKDFLVGLDYYNGTNGKSIDYTKAFSLFSRAAQAGVDEACFHLAECYRQGNGTPKDISRAIYWHEKIVGVSSYKPILTKLKLAVDYEKLGGQQNITNAIRLHNENLQTILKYEKEDTYTLGFLYYAMGICHRGLRTPADMEKYREYIKKSAQLGDSDAIEELAKM